MDMHYILDENNNPVPEPDYIKWARWEANALNYEKKRIGLMTFQYGDAEIKISTVFLSLPHFDPDLRSDHIQDRFYETMVFGPDELIEQLCRMSESETRSLMAQVFGDFEIMKRYRTREQAEQGHAQMVNFVEVCLAQMDRSHYG